MKRKTFSICKRQVGCVSQNFVSNNLVITFNFNNLITETVRFFYAGVLLRNTGRREDVQLTES